MRCATHLKQRPIFFVDANTIWHLRLAEAVGELQEAIAFLPHSCLSRASWPARRCPSASANVQRLRTISKALVPGWATRFAEFGQRQIASAIRALSRRTSGEPVIVLTSPAYRVLSRILEGRYPLIYYGADDYQSYVGWGGMKMRDAEAEIATRVDLAIFVSDALRTRAIADYGVKDSSTFTSPNATEPRFVGNGERSRPQELSRAARPVVGVLGGLSSRLDFDLLAAIANLSVVGSLIIIGPTDPAVSLLAAKLRAHPKVIITGMQPHDAMHEFALAIDIALIPYAQSPINYYCSPMRLFDHLASGIKIFATTACDQINLTEDPALVSAAASCLPNLLSEWISSDRKLDISPRPDVDSLFWSARAERILARIHSL
jgi:hypothetical protein